MSVLLEIALNNGRDSDFDVVGVMQSICTNSICFVG